MPRVPNFQFTGPTHLLLSPVLDSQRSINLYPEAGLGDSKSRLNLAGRPGLNPSGPLVTLAGGNVRGLWPGNHRLFACGGQHIYEVSNAGAIITDFGSLGALSPTGPVFFEQNSGSSAFQLIALDTAQTKLFNVNSGTLTAVFNATAQTMADGFQVAVATGASLVNAGNPNQINCSAFGDATNWTPLPGPLPTYVIRTGSSDLVNGLAWLNGLLYIFGTKRLEIWYDAGNPGFPFARVNGGQIGLGLLGPWTIVNFYNCIMFMGSDGTGYAQVYMMQGMNPVRVSDASIEYLISQQSSWLLGGMTAYGYQESGHTFYCLCLSNGSQLVYDLTTGLWHERVYAGPNPQTFASLPAFAVNAGGNYVGDSGSGAIYLQSIQYPADYTTAITYTRQSGPVFRDNLVHTFDRFELDCDIGTAAATLNWSNDGGRNFGTQARAMKQAANQGGPSGAPWGTRYFVNQMGRSRDMRLQVNITSSTQLVRIAQGLLDCDNTGPPTEDA